jgi:phytanoyl-CoA hydroxylase
MGKVLTDEQIAFYREQGYLHARQVIPVDALELARVVLGRWVDQLLDTWVAKGLLQHNFGDVDMARRLVVAWDAAGRPAYSRSPRRDLISLEDLLGTPEISVHGIFNARPKLPDQKWTDTPWHQDAQYYRDAEHVHVLSLWMPLQRVTEHNSCLQIAPGHHQDPLYANYDDAETGFVGLSPEDRKNLVGRSVEMDAGDVLCFTQRMPHRALSNQSDTVRWSMDVRYEATTNATESGKKQGFIARSPSDPQQVLPFEAWMHKWDAIPAGSY